MAMPSFQVPDGELEQLYLIAGLYGDDKGWLSRDEVNGIALHIGAFDASGLYIPGRETDVAVEMLNVYGMRNPEQAENARLRRLQLKRGRGVSSVLPDAGASALEAQIVSLSRAVAANAENIQALEDAGTDVQEVEDIVERYTGQADSDSDFDINKIPDSILSRIQALEDAPPAVETVLLPAKSSGQTGRRATVTMTWTLTEIRTVDAEFAAPAGDYLLSSHLSTHAVFSVERTIWDTTNSRLEVTLRNESSGNANFQGRVTLTVLRGADSSVPSGVTADQLEAEAKLREAGDDYQIEEVGTRQRYIDVVALQVNSHNPLRMIITADIQVPPASGVGPDRALVNGEILEFPPRSNAAEPYRTVNLHWQADQTHVSDTAETEAQWNSKTSAHANAHNHLWLRVTKRLFSTISGARRAREIGELYHIPPRSTVAEFIVDTTSKEEADAIVNAAIENGVAFWARAAPGNVVNNQRAYPLPADLAPTPETGYYLSNDGNKNVWKALPAAGELDDGAVTTAKLAARAVTGDKLARNTVGGDNLITRVQAALLQLRTDPVRESAGGAYTIAFGDAGLLGGSLFIQIRMNGRLVGAREAWTQQATLTRTPNAADLAEMAKVSTTSVIITADWYSQQSGGNLVAGANYEVAIVPKPVAPAITAVQKLANAAAYTAITTKSATTLYYVAKA